MKQSVRWFGVLFVAFSLSACGTGETPIVSAPSGDAGVSLPQPQEAQTVKSSDPQASDILCPKIELRSGTDTLRNFEVGSPGSAADLKWQATITSMARECSILGVEVGVKVAISGRIILGPKGKPGTFKAPVRIAVVRKGAEPLWSKVANVDAIVPAGEASGVFTLVVEDILFPREPADTLADVQILAGFDPESPKAAKAGKSKR